MTTPQVHRTLLIAEELRGVAIALIVTAAGAGQAGMLKTPVMTQPVYAEGEEEGEIIEVSPALLSHYMSTGKIDEPFADILSLDAWDGTQYIRIQQPNYSAMIEISGGLATQEELELLLGEAIITNERWQDTLAHLNLTLEASP